MQPQTSPQPETPRVGVMPVMPGSLDAKLEWLANQGEEWLAGGDAEAARMAFQMVLKMEEGHELATLGLCKLTEDWKDAVSLLQTMLRRHPNSAAGLTLLREAQFRNSQLVEIEEMVQSSHYLQRWDEKQKNYADLMNYGGRKTTGAITRIGELMVQANYISKEQLDTAVSLQSMLNRLQNHEPLGKVLLDYGYITKPQLDEILRTQQREYESYLY